MEFEDLVGVGHADDDEEHLVEDENGKEAGHDSGLEGEVDDVKLSLCEVLDGGQDEVGEYVVLEDVKVEECGAGERRDQDGEGVPGAVEGLVAAAARFRDLAAEKTANVRLDRNPPEIKFGFEL